MPIIRTLLGLFKEVQSPTPLPVTPLRVPYEFRRLGFRGLGFSIGAETITLLGVPYYNCCIMGLKPYSNY